MNELEIVKYFNQLGLNSPIDFMAAFVSYIPFLVALWLVLGILAISFDKKDGKMIFTALVVSILFYLLFSEYFLKHFVLNFYPMRIRPYLAHPGDIVLIAKQAIGPLVLTKNFADSSFPSGHMGSNLAVFTVFVYFYRKAWPLVLAFILFMAYSRMHMGMHYPTDILFGTALGIGCGILSLIITKKIFKKKNKKK